MASSSSGSTAQDRPRGDNKQKSAPAGGISSQVSGQNSNRLTTTNPISKKPRDSLCIKRYEKLSHAARQLIYDNQAQARVAAPIESIRQMGEPAQETVLSRPGSEDRQEEEEQDSRDSGWGSQGYRDVSPRHVPPPKTDVKPETNRAESTVPTEPNTKFMWDAVRFPSGLDENSFEESLAKRHQLRRQAATLAATPPAVVLSGPNRAPSVTEYVLADRHPATIVNVAVLQLTTPPLKVLTVIVPPQPESTAALPPAARLSVAPPPSIKVVPASPSPKELELADRLHAAEQQLLREKEQRLMAEQNLRNIRIQSPSPKELELAAKLQAAEQQLLYEREQHHLAEQNLRSLRAQLAVSRDHLETAEAKIWALDEKIRSDGKEQVAHQDQVAERLRLSDLKYHTARDILQSITSSLVIFGRDLSKYGHDHLEAVVQFADTVREKIDLIIGGRTGNGPDEHLKALQSVTHEVTRCVEEWRVRALAKASAKPIESIQRKANETTFGDDEMRSMRSDTRSSLLPSSQQSDRTDPRIKAMWNQTANQTMNCTRDQQPKPASDPSKSRIAVFADFSSVCQPAGNPAGHGEMDAVRPVAPIRQSLAPRKSVKQLQTIATEDSENLPVFPQARQPANFCIYADQSCGPEYLPAVPPRNNIDAEKESDDESENTPPLSTYHEDLASKSQARHVAGVLNESLDHPGVPVERLTDNDYIEVAESDSDGELGQAPQPPGAQPAARTSRLIFAPAPMPRRSLGFGDFHEEFNTTVNNDYNGRRSLGGTDQTLSVFPSDEMDFFRSIDPKKHMASTPVVLSIADEQAVKERMRNKPRVSYLPPAGASKLLSPITEGSRENKSGTPSSSGVSTWYKSKNSTGVSKKSLGGI